MSKARQKGTVGENYFLPRLRRMFGENVERAPLKGVQDKGDFTGVPWLHESKNTATPLFLEWASKAEAKVKGPGWVVMWKGDLRRATRNGPYVLMPFDLYELLVNYATDNWMYQRDRTQILKDDIEFIGAGGKL